MTWVCSRTLTFGDWNDYSVADILCHDLNPVCELQARTCSWLFEAETLRTKFIEMKRPSEPRLL